jgi:hypothetical protein
MKPFGHDRFLLYILISTCSVNSVLGQQSGHAGPELSAPGKITAILTPRFHPTSLWDLVRGSHLIIDGTVVQALTPIPTRADKFIPLIETHSVIAVNAVLGGALPEPATFVLLSQFGGKHGGVDIVAADDPIVGSGERYVFFLVPDNRPEVPNTSGLQRYSVAGGWNGRAGLVDSKVRFLPRAAANLRSLDGSKAEDFIDSIRRLVENPPKPRTPLPIHPDPSGGTLRR